MHYAVRFIEHLVCTDDAWVDQNLKYRLIPFAVSYIQIRIITCSAGTWNDRQLQVGSFSLTVLNEKIPQKNETKTSKGGTAGRRFENGCEWIERGQKPRKNEKPRTHVARLVPGNGNFLEISTTGKLPGSW